MTKTKLHTTFLILCLFIAITTAHAQITCKIGDTSYVRQGKNYTYYKTQSTFEIGQMCKQFVLIKNDTLCNR
jgi:hypothetical protein